MSGNRETANSFEHEKVSRNRENSKILLIQKTSLTRGPKQPFRCLDLDQDQNLFRSEGVPVKEVAVLPVMDGPGGESHHQEHFCPHQDSVEN